MSKYNLLIFKYSQHHFLLTPSSLKMFLVIVYRHSIIEACTYCDESNLLIEDDAGSVNTIDSTDDIFL